jgi:segregation and condensation protein A
MIAPMDPVAGRSHLLEVKTPVFEGPLELLVALAERDDLDILKVPLADLTDAYLVELAALTTPDPAQMADFLWLASRLLLLKSIRLLPGEPAGEEEADLLGWEEQVRRRLEEYRAYKEMAQALVARVDEETFSFSPPVRVVEVDGQEEPLAVDVLVAAFHDVLSRLPPRPLVVRGRSWTVDEKLDLLEARLRAGAVDLLELILASEDRLEAVVTFVAVLELLRRGAIRIRQRERFGPIAIERRA